MKSVGHLFFAVCLYGTVSGCGTSIISANPRQVIVESQMMDAKEAQRLADGECAKNKRYAKMTFKADYWERNYTFECIE